MLAGNSLVLTENGLLPIEKLAGKEAKTYLSGSWYDTEFFHAGEREVFRVQFTSGLYLDVTEDQVVLFGKKEIPAGDSLNKTVVVQPTAKGWSGFTYSSVDDDDMVMLGFIQGDGSFPKDKEAVVVNIGDKDEDVYAFFKRKYSDFEVPRESRTAWLPSDHPLATLSKKIQIPRLILPERHLAENIFGYNVQSTKMFIRGLYSANGTVILTGAKGAPKSLGRVTLRSTCRRLIKEVHTIFGALGYRGYVTTNKATEVKFRNGVYKCRESYDLSLSGIFARRYGKEIGFLHQYKMDKLRKLRSSSQISPHPVKVQSLESLGVQDVYGFNGGFCWIDGFHIGATANG